MNKEVESDNDQSRYLEIKYRTEDGWSVVSEDKIYGGRVAYKEQDDGSLLWRRDAWSEADLTRQFEAYKAQEEILGIEGESVFFEEGKLYVQDLGIPFLGRRRELGWQGAIDEIYEYLGVLAEMYDREGLVELDSAVRNIAIDPISGRVANVDMSEVYSRDLLETGYFSKREDYVNYLWTNIQEDWSLWLGEHFEGIDLIHGELENRGIVGDIDIPFEIPMIDL